MAAAYLFGGKLISVKERDGSLVALPRLEMPARDIEQVANPALTGQTHEIAMENSGGRLNDPATTLHIR